MLSPKDKAEVTTLIDAAVLPTQVGVRVAILLAVIGFLAAFVALGFALAAGIS